MPRPPRALASYFSGATRAKGQQYASAGRVRLLHLDQDRIDARVQGGEPYVVRVECQTGGSHAVVLLGCTCPYFDQELEPCKHLWAALVAAADREWAGGAALDKMPASAVEVVPIAASELIADPAVAAHDRGAPDPGDLFLKGLDTHLATRDAARTHARGPAGELAYVVDAAATARTGQVALDIGVRKRKRDGSWGRPQPARMHEIDLAQIPPADADVLAALMGAGGYLPWQTRYSLRDALGRIVIPAAAKTRRLYARTPDASDLAGPLVWDDGAPWTFRLSTARTADGFQLDVSFVRQDDSIGLADTLIATSSGFLFTRAAVGRVDWHGAFGVFSTLAKFGSVEVAEASAPRLATLLARGNVPAADLPDALRLGVVSSPPGFLLHLRTPEGWRARSEFDATVSFDYDGTRLEPDGAAVEWDTPRGRLVHRDAAAEAAAADQLAAAGVTLRYDPASRRQVRTVSAAGMPAAVRALTRDGWRIEADGRAFRQAGAVHIAVEGGTDIDWFDLRGTVDFGETSMPLPDVLAALSRGESSVRLGEAGVGILPEDWLRRYGPLAAWGAVDGDRVRFRRTQTALLDALLLAQAETASVTVDEVFRGARAEMQRFERITAADAPASFQGVLREYQREGLGWLQFLRQFGFGGCLADDMGLGKTVMVLALLEWRRAGRLGQTPQAAGPRASLVVVPRSLIQNWIAEARRFAPDLRVLDYSHGKRADTAEMITDHDLVLITYGTLRRDAAELASQEFEYVILDEAQSIKNSATASAKAARLLKGRHRLALSGTPIENHLGELWSLFEFLNPGMLGAMRVFQRASGASRVVDPETADLLARALKPFILRRTKEQVAPELPARTEQTITCELEGRQRAFYNALRAHYREALLGRVDRLGLGRSKIQILEALLRLRQAACHPGLIDAAHESAGSAKLDALVPRLQEVLDEGHKALVFSQFTSFLALLRARLDADAVVYEYLDGQTHDRQARVDRFQSDPDCRLFLISLKAGGLGLNLTAADYVFLLDPWWNPAVEAQAIDRTHRIGQTRQVFAYRLIAGDTVEQKVLELQRTKRQLADAILRADAGLVGQLKREDLELLLS